MLSEEALKDYRLAAGRGVRRRKSRTNPHENVDLIEASEIHDGAAILDDIAHHGEVLYER